MNRLKIKGKSEEKKGLEKQKEAAAEKDSFKCLEGKEEALTGRLQKKFAKGEDEILKALEEPDTL